MMGCRIGCMDMHDGMNLMTNRSHTAGMHRSQRLLSWRSRLERQNRPQKTQSARASAPPDPTRRRERDNNIPVASFYRETIHNPTLKAAKINPPHLKLAGPMTREKPKESSRRKHTSHHM